MKRCPECRRDYFDETQLYCLDDGAHLVEGPASVDEAATAILSEPEAVATGFRNLANQASRRNSIIAAALGIAVMTALGVGGYLYYGQGDPGQIESIAVLPFENGSNNAELDYLSDGLSESLIDKLSQLPKLKVSPRTSSFKFRGANVDPQEVSKRLGVRAVIMGRLIKRGDQISVRVEMIDTVENKQIWGAQYDRNASDALLIQQEISQVVSDRLRLSLSGEQGRNLDRSGTTHPRAYESMLKARYLLNQGRSDRWAIAADHLKQAVAADPEYALAHAMLATAYRLVAQIGADPDVTFERAENVARKALELDPELSEAHYALAGVYRSTWRFQEAEVAYKRAIALDPHQSGPRGSYATLLSIMKRFDNAIAEASRARDLDPLSGNAHDIYCRQLWFARRYDELIIAANKWAEFDQDNPEVNGWLGVAYENKRLYDQAIAEYAEGLENAADEERLRWESKIARVKTRKGDRQAGMTMLRTLKAANVAATQDISVDMAVLHALLGDSGASFDILEKGYAARAEWLIDIHLDPNLDAIRDNPRFMDLVKRVGLPE